MNRLETMLYNAIMVIFDESQMEYEGLDDELFVEMICNEIGLTEAEYEELIAGNTSECEWNLEE